MSVPKSFLKGPGLKTVKAILGYCMNGPTSAEDASPRKSMHKQVTAMADVKPRPCPVCSALFTPQGRPGKQKILGKSHACPTCEKALSCHVLLYRIDKAPRLEDMSIYCGLEESKDVPADATDVKNLHIARMPRLSTIFSCSYCNFSCDRKHYLCRHERLHMVDRPFKCSHCKRAFTRMEHMKSHEQSHLLLKSVPTKTKKYKLVENESLSKIPKRGRPRKNPGESSLVAKNLGWKHREQHSKGRSISLKSQRVWAQRQYKCSFCGVTCKQKYHLKYHERCFHTGEKPFVCSRCGQGFLRRNALKYHENRHLLIRSPTTEDMNKSDNNVVFTPKSPREQVRASKESNPSFKEQGSSTMALMRRKSEKIIIFPRKRGRPSKVSISQIAHKTGGTDTVAVMPPIKFDEKISRKRGRPPKVLTVSFKPTSTVSNSSSNIPAERTGIIMPRTEPGKKIQCPLCPRQFSSIHSVSYHCVMRHDRSLQFDEPAQTADNVSFSMGQSSSEKTSSSMSENNQAPSFHPGKNYCINHVDNTVLNGKPSQSKLSITNNAKSSQVNSMENAMGNNEIQSSTGKRKRGRPPKHKGSNFPGEKHVNGTDPTVAKNAVENTDIEPVHGKRKRGRPRKRRKVSKEANLEDTNPSVTDKTLTNTVTGKRGRPRQLTVSTETKDDAESPIIKKTKIGRKRKCPFCSSEFLTLSDIYDHFILHHRLDKSKLEEISGSVVNNSPSVASLDNSGSNLIMEILQSQLRMSGKTVEPEAVHPKEDSGGICSPKASPSEEKISESIPDAPVHLRDIRSNIIARLRQTLGYDKPVTNGISSDPGCSAVKKSTSPKKLCKDGEISLGLIPKFESIEENSSMDLSLAHSGEEQTYKAGDSPRDSVSTVVVPDYMYYIKEEPESYPVDHDFMNSELNSENNTTQVNYT